MRSLALCIGILVAAGAGWFLGGLIPPDSPETVPVYDHQVAYHLASLGVPAKTKEYFLFDLNSFGARAEQAKELAGALRTANASDQYLGLIGSDAEHNLEVLRRAVKQIGENATPSMTLIVVGPANQEAQFRQAAAPSQANFQYYHYP